MDISNFVLWWCGSDSQCLGIQWFPIDFLSRNCGLFNNTASFVCAHLIYSASQKVGESIYQEVGYAMFDAMNALSSPRDGTVFDYCNRVTCCFISNEFVESCFLVSRLQPSWRTGVLFDWMIHTFVLVVKLADIYIL